MERKKLTAAEAAKALKVSRTTFERKREEWGLKSTEPRNPLLNRQTFYFWKDEVEALKERTSG